MHEFQHNEKKDPAKNAKNLKGKCCDVHMLYEIGIQPKEILITQEKEQEKHCQKEKLKILCVHVGYELCVKNTTKKISIQKRSVSGSHKQIGEGIINEENFVIHQRFQ